MIKTVAVALVLIAGAAVVLWYGNTLNSLVLGGLIGGLAALLLSIPISLTLFSYLSRRHDERLRAERQEYEEFAHIQTPGYQHKLAYVVSSEDEEAYQEGTIFSEEEGWQEEIIYHQNAPQRYLSAPGELRSEMHTSRKLPVDNRNSSLMPPAQTTKKLPARGKSQSTQRPATTRALSTGLPGYQTSAFRSQYQSEALRIARKEAAHQNDEDRDDVSSTQISRRMSSGRPVRRAFEQEEYLEQDEQPRSTRQGSQSPATQSPQRPRRNRDGSVSPNSSRRPFVPEDERTDRQSRRIIDPRTDQLDPDILSNEMNKPLQRRAPYMYKDDELREQLSQHIDGPVTRRSSRKLVQRSDEE